MTRFTIGTALLFGLATWWDSHPTLEPFAKRVVVSQAGRDQALIRLLRGAKRGIRIRTERLCLTPIGNELAQAIQRNIPVAVELPLQSGMDRADSCLPRILMGLGGIVVFRSDPDRNYRGTYVEVDNQTFFYSAAPLDLCPPGAMVSYVVGPLEGRL